MHIHIHTHHKHHILIWQANIINIINETTEKYMNKKNKIRNRAYLLNYD